MIKYLIDSPNLTEKVGKVLELIGTGMGFLNRIPIAQPLTLTNKWTSQSQKVSKKTNHTTIEGREPTGKKKTLSAMHLTEVRI